MAPFHTFINSFCQGACYQKPVIPSMSKTFYHLLSTHVHNLRACHSNHKTLHVRNYNLRIAFQYNQRPHWTQRVSQTICWQHFGISTQLPFRLQNADIFDKRMTVQKGQQQISHLDTIKLKKFDTLSFANQQWNTQNSVLQWAVPTCLFIWANISHHTLLGCTPQLLPRFFLDCAVAAAMILSKASEPLSSMNWATELRASGLMEDKNLRWLSVNFASAFWTVL